MAECGPEEDVLLLLVLVARQKLLLLRVEKPDHIALSQRTREGDSRGERKERERK